MKFKLFFFNCQKYISQHLKKEFLIGLFVLLFYTNNLMFGQIQLDILNNLPHTKEVRAPGFDTEKKYLFSVDTLKKNLFIQDIRLSKNGEYHYYQWLYELPLCDLNAQSFKLSRNSENDMEIEITISTSNKKPTILWYWFDDNKMNNILGASEFKLGSWPYSEELYKILNIEINKLNLEVAKLEKSTTSVTSSGGFKFYADNVKLIDAKYDDDLTIGNGYLFRQFVRDDASFLSNQIVTFIKSKLSGINIKNKYKIPVIIYANEMELENILLINPELDSNIQFDKSKFTLFEKIEKPTKYIFLLN